MDRYRSFLFGFGVLLISAAAQAQQVGGCALQGRVIDQQQAVLPGVTIIITNQDTGTFRDTVTGPDGTYFATGLQAGRYKVTAELSGFKRFIREDVSLVLGNTQTNSRSIRFSRATLRRTGTTSSRAPGLPSP